MKTPFLFFLLLLFCGGHAARAGGVRGTVRNAKGEPLPYASVLVLGTNLGTMANDEGQYAVTLKPGKYEVQFQYLGHQVLVQPVAVTGDEFVTLDVVMQETVVQLGEVKVGAGDEDPAYTIMRKTISMARFHALEVDSWSARTYVKGTFRVLDVPLLLRGALKKSNLQVGTTYVLESINDLTFRQPDVVREKAVSIRSNLPPGSQPSINFAQLSIYRPNFMGIVLPLSPKAFGYYRFTYEGGFEERGRWINRIRVKPRTPGANRLEGSLYIVDGMWSVHSYRFSFADENGIRYQLQQLYTPVQEVWMPIQSEITVKADLFGAAGEARYVTSVRNYQLKLNPAYHRPPAVVDENTDREKAAELRRKDVSAEVALQQKELTRKQLRRLARDLEKQDRQQRRAQGEDVSVVRDYGFEVDTLARQQPADFWNQERQVPLTDLETKGYRQADSLYRANREKIARDSVRNLPRFRPAHLLFGHTYQYGRQTENEGHPRSLAFHTPLLNLNDPADWIYNGLGHFNTVEGFVLRTRARYTQRVDKHRRWSLEGNLRYAFARQRLNGGLAFYRGGPARGVTVSAGRNVFQFNPANPIPESINTVNTLVWEQNYMKLYEKAYASVQWNRRFVEQLSFSTSVAVERRMHLQNRTLWSLFDHGRRTFTSNDPANLELDGRTAFPDHTALLWDASLTFRPFAKAGIYNGRRYVINNNSPVFTLRNQSGLGGTRFNHLELSVADAFRLLRGRLRYLAGAGTFYGRLKPLYFMDFKHFNGNQTRFQPEGLDQFRLLDYYRYSTANNHLQGHAEFEPNRLLLTRFTALRLYGIREMVFANVLATTRTNVLQVGYGFGGLLKVLGAEVVSTFQDGRYIQTGLRLKVGFQ